MTDLKGKTIEYCYQNGDRYRVSFTKLGATWTALSGPAAGSSGTENYKCAMVAPNVFFITWLEETREVVSLIVDLDNAKVVCSYVHEWLFVVILWSHGVICASSLNIFILFGFFKVVLQI